MKAISKFLKEQFRKLYIQNFMRSKKIRFGDFAVCEIFFRQSASLTENRLHVFFLHLLISILKIKMNLYKIL